ncbi:hypothetical protein WDJ51_14315 [Rathayibacter sp. YIM 133350]|uniref:hypothetical protein n=1 Tax=Rathayibacter sp. YIM 133350 TaxID=3131992 RepID=UPI00307EDE44
MTAALTAPGTAPARSGDISRIVRLHLVSKSVFLGIPWIIVGGALAVSIVIGIILQSAGIDPGAGMRYSWAVLSPQWYLVVAGVQAVGLTFSFALGLTATRRDFWLGTMLLFVLVALFNGVAFTILIALEKATGGWWLDIHMFDALWYGIDGPFVDFYTTFALQLAVLVVGAAATTVYMRWRIPGMLWVALGAVVLLLAALAILTATNGWLSLIAWFGSIGLVGGFSLLVGLAAVLAVGGYVVIRGATPRS